MVYDCVFITNPGICRMLYEVIFPWIFCFAIIFGLLIRSRIFGESIDKTNRGVSAIIGLVAGFLIVMGFGPSMGAFLASISAWTVMFLAVIMGIVLVITLINPGFVYGEGEEGKVTLKSAGLIGIIIVVAWLILSGTGSGMGWYNWYSLQQDLLALAIVIVVMGLMMWFVMGTREGGESKKS